MTSDAPRPLRVLWVATKPPWPPRDGGRLLQWLTLDALAALGGEVEVDLVTPLAGGDAAAIARELLPLCRPHLVAARPLPLPLAWLQARLSGVPVTVVRHRLPAVRRRVETLAAASGVGPAVVHAEQAQAMPQALAAGLPVVLRAQNVESDLWWASAGQGSRWPVGRAGALRHEARRLARWEGEMVRRATRAVALTAADASRLTALAAAGGERPATVVEPLPVPFPADLPAGPPLPGAPAVVLLAGAGWRPNREGAERFLAASWPLVLQRHPGARLHLFGDVASTAAGVERHPPPVDGALAFAAGAILVVPLLVASGIRMKVLEAWARGIPVVASPAAAAGLAATAGDELLVAEVGAPMAAAVSALAADAGGLGARLVAGGRRALAARHRPRAAAEALLAAYRAAAGSSPARR
jgi:polysaccharide biosynthesis protein PslH